MSQKAQINFNVNQLDRDGKPFRNISSEKADELGIKTEKELNDRREEFPPVTLGEVLDIMFDHVALSSNKIFAIYNDVLNDIRKARIENKDMVEIEKTDLEVLKKVFEKGIDGKPNLNRRCGFIYQMLDTALANCIFDNKEKS